MEPLAKLGWDNVLQEAWQGLDLDFCVPGRVIADYGSGYKVAAPAEMSAEVPGRLQYLLEFSEMPKGGDWVAVQVLEDGHGLIHEVLPRRSEISRKQPGKKYEKQVLAANVDMAFLVQALDDDFSPERLQRYLFQLRRENVTPVLVLNKSDKAGDLAAKMSQLEALGAKILVTSALEGRGIDEIAGQIDPGRTAVFLGSSGVGKSTITNALLGEQRQVTAAIREADSKGRHTTTHRELFVLPNGGLIIDTPGLRELQLWGTEDDLEAAFPDIEELARTCRFTNCTHLSEPGCAIMEAIKAGTLSDERLQDYFKIQKELQFLATKVDAGAALERKQAYRKAQAAYNQQTRAKNRPENETAGYR